MTLKRPKQRGGAKKKQKSQLRVQNIPKSPKPDQDNESDEDQEDEYDSDKVNMTMFYDPRELI